MANGSAGCIGSMVLASGEASGNKIMAEDKGEANTSYTAGAGARGRGEVLHTFKQTDFRQVQWLTPVIPALWEGKVGRS